MQLERVRLIRGYPEYSWVHEQVKGEFEKTFVLLTQVLAEAEQVIADPSSNELETVRDISTLKQMLEGCKKHELNLQRVIVSLKGIQR